MAVVALWLLVFIALGAGPSMAQSFFQEVWSESAEGASLNDPVVADVLADGEPLIIVSDTEGRVRARRASSGRLVWSVRVEGRQLTAPMVGAFTASGSLDVVVMSRDATGKALYLLQGSNGKLLATLPLGVPPRDAATPFPLAAVEGRPVRHGIAINCPPYLLQVSDDGSDVTPLRELPSNTINILGAGAPLGPPAVGRIFGPDSVDIVYSFRRQVVVINRDGTREAVYRLPAQDTGEIVTPPIVANARQHQRTDAQDFDNIIFGVYTQATDTGHYYLLEFNEAVPANSIHAPFLSHWFQQTTMAMLDRRPYDPVTMNIDRDPDHIEILLSSSAQVSGYTGLLDRRFVRHLQQQGQFIAPLAFQVGDHDAVVMVFARKSGQLDDRVELIYSKNPRSTVESYPLPLLPLRQPVVGNFTREQDGVTKPEVIFISSDRIASYRMPLLQLDSISPIAFQTRGGDLYRSGGMSQRVMAEESFRAEWLRAEQERNLVGAREALDASRWADAATLAQAVLRVNPTVSEAQAMANRIFIRRNLLALLSGGILAIAALGGLIYLLRRIQYKNSNMRRAAMYAETGQPDQALNIYHNLYKHYPNDPKVLDALVLTIIRNGFFEPRSIAPLRRYFEKHENRSDVMKSLVLCHVNRRDTDARLLPLYRRAEEHLTGNGLLKYLMGHIYREQGDNKLAMENLRASVKCEDPPNEAFVELADMLLNAEQANSRNLAIFERAYVLQPDDVGFLRGLCLAMIDAKRIDAAAQKVYQKMLEHDKTHVPALLQLCQAKIEGGLIEEAVAHAHRIQQLDPENQEGIRMLSQCYLIQGRSDETAIRTLRRAAEIFPKDKDILCTLARTFIQQKRADEEAIAYYRRAWELNPNDAEVARTMAKVAWAQKDMPLVIRVNEKLIELGASTPKNMVQLAEAYVATDMRDEKGEKVLKEALRAEPENRRFLTHLSRVCISSGRVDAEAMKIYQIAYQETPSFDIGRQLIKAWYHNDQFNEISQLGPKLLQQKPEDDELQRILAQSNVANNRIDDAIQQYEQMLAHNPEDVDALVSLAQAYAQKGRIDAEAAVIYRRALEKRPDLEVLWLMAGRLAMAAGNQDEAVGCFKQALKLSPNKPDKVIRELQVLLAKHVGAIRLRWLQAEVLVFANRLREAAEELTAIFETDPQQMPLVIQGYDKILQRDPRNITSLVARGRLRVAAGQFENARRDLETALELNPLNPDALRELADLYQAILKEDEDMEVRHRLGVVYMRMEEYDRAIAAFQRSSQDYRFEAEATKLLGQCFVHKNMLDLALQQFKGLPVDEELKEILYDLAQRYEQKKDLVGAKTVYKTLFAADISYRDVKVKFEALAGSTSDPMVFEKTVMQQNLSPAAQLRYELIQELGRGAMGIVYKAKDHELDEVVALKILPDSISNNPEAVKRFRIEARSARRLSHPHIVRIHDIGEEQGRKFISMEFVEGTDLKAKFRAEGPPPLALLAQWCQDIGSALAYAHRMGIVHRDIKPANIMITKQGVLKVADFGIAKNMGAADATMTGAVMGTPLYMSPEQVRGESIDHRADIYSFGVMMYELTSGRPPFTEGDLAYQHINVDPKPIDGCEPRWAALVLKCLAKRREDRWDTLDEMVEHLRTFKNEL